MKKMLLTLSAAGLALAPIAAQAATRAGDVVPSANTVSRSVTGVNKVERGYGNGIGVAAPLALIVLTIVIAIIDENDDNDSDG